MTTPRFGTDPLSGASYAYKGQLTSAQMNQLLGWLRGIDYAIEYNQAVTWPVVDLTLTSACSAIGIDKKWNRLIAVVTATGDTTPNTLAVTMNGTEQTSLGTPVAPAGGWTTDVSVVCSNDTVTIMGAKTVNASAQKVATLTADGTDWDIRSMANAEAGVGPLAMVWDPVNSLFIAAINGTGATGKLETSPNGQTWTARTASTATTPSALATDGMGTTVALLSGSTNVAMRSANGTTWANVTLPATREWSCVTYSKGLGLWLAGDGQATGSETGMNLDMASSTDGITWASHTFSGPSHSPKLLGSTGNLVFMVSGYGNSQYARFSNDGAAYKVAVKAALSTTLSAMACSENVIAVLSGAGTELSISAYYAI